MPPKSKKIKILSSTNSDRKIKILSSTNSDRKIKTKKKQPPKIKQSRKKPIIIIEESTDSSIKYKPFLKKDKIESDLALSSAEPFQKKDKIESDLALSSAKSFPNVDKDLAPPFLKVDKVDKDLKKSPQNTIMPQRYNEKFINLMDQLAAIQIKQGEPFRARAYQKAQETIMKFPGDIHKAEDLKGLPNIGPTIMEKLNEYVETGTLRIIEREKTNPVNILADVYGIGPKKAKELVDKGITSIEQLRQNQDLLNDVQKIGLKYYEDVLKRIPRAEIDEYKQIVQQVAQKVSPFLKVEIVGSYRRGAENSGDIDIIITSTDSKNLALSSAEPFEKVDIIDELIKQKIIVAVLSRGPSKCLVMAKIPSSPTIRRVDFLYTSPEEFPFAILYFTGSKIFNTMMRQHALNMGLTMNEHGLYKMINKTKGEKVPHIFKTEKDIFDYLNLQYVPPEERISPPLGKVEPNPQFGYTFSKGIVEPNQPLGKVEPNPQFGYTFSKGIVDEEPIQLAPKAPKAPKITKSKTLKAKKKIALNSAEPFPKVDKNLALNSAEPFPKVDKDLALNSAEPFLKVEKVDKDLAPPFLKVDLAQPFQKVDLAPPFPKVDMFKKNGIPYLDSLTEEELISILNYANTMYRNFQPVMTDNEYDILEDYIKEKYPDNQALTQVGAPVTKNKVKLPYFMGSMDKIKPDTNALTNWKAKYTGPYVLSCKLDGVSGLYTTEGKGGPKLYTRGDGKVGQDISYLIPYLRLPKNPNLVIRGEFIIPKSTFNAKYKTTFANARNMVSGIVNQKSVNPEIIKDVDFVAYEVIKPLLKPSEQFATLKQLDINVVEHKIIGEFGSKGGLDNELLSNMLIEWRQSSPYEIDGVIVTDDKIYPVRKEGNPEHSFAFKMVLSDQIAEAKVVDVIWTPSKDGYLKPRVQIEPLNLGGVRIEYATGFNGQFIQENKIGIGAVIELIRSGDVIPHIRKVTTPATEAKMPNVPYKWNDTHVDIMLEDIDTDEIVKEKVLTGFFRGIEVEGLSSGNIKRMIQAGYDSVPKILQMTTNDLLKVEGFKEKTAQKLHNNIQTQIQSSTLVTIMAASNIFGRGFSDKKLELIIDEYPDVLLSNESQNIKTQKVAAIKGMAAKTAEAFISKIPAFLAFVKEANLEYKLNQQDKENKSQKKQLLDQSHPLYNKTIVFTGFRDKTLEEQLKAVGAKLGSSVSKNTFIVLTKDKHIDGDETGKVLEAKKLNVPIMTPEEFIHLLKKVEPK